MRSLPKSCVLPSVQHHVGQQTPWDAALIEHWKYCKWLAITEEYSARRHLETVDALDLLLTTGAALDKLAGRPLAKSPKRAKHSQVAQEHCLRRTLV